MAIPPLLILALTRVLNTPTLQLFLTEKLYPQAFQAQQICTGVQHWGQLRLTQLRLLSSKLAWHAYNCTKDKANTLSDSMVCQLPDHPVES